VAAQVYRLLAVAAQSNLCVQQVWYWTCFMDTFRQGNSAGNCEKSAFRLSPCMWSARARTVQPRSKPGKESDMAKTVVALIHDIDEAQSVVRDLVASGFQREDIGFRGNEGHAVPSTAALNESEGSVEDVSSDGIVVAVAAETDAQAQGAVEVMQRHGATDIDQRATEWKKQGWKGRFDAA
jgi:hypothetical protein